MHMENSQILYPNRLNELFARQEQEDWNRLVREVKTEIIREFSNSETVIERLQKYADIDQEKQWEQFLEYNRQHWRHRAPGSDELIADISGTSRAGRDKTGPAAEDHSLYPAGSAFGIPSGTGRAYGIQYTAFKPQDPGKTGGTFSDILQRVRLEEAAVLLRETDLTVEQIAERTGYQSISGIYKRFRTVFHMTPNEYRKRNRRYC